MGMSRGKMLLRRSRGGFGWVGVGYKHVAPTELRKRHFRGCLERRWDYMRRTSESASHMAFGVTRHKKREALQAKSLALVEESRNPNFWPPRNNNVPSSATSCNAGRNISRENT